MYKVLSWLSLVVMYLGVIGCDSSNSLSLATPALSTDADKSQVLKANSTGREGTKRIEDKIVARIGDQGITQTSLDETVQLRLFDLEWRAYEIRRQALSAKIDSELKHRFDKNEEPVEVTITLIPPSPPRLTLPADDRTVKGNSHARVSLAVFCSYQSSHCARLQPVLSELENYFGQAINMRFYDLPLGYHRYAKEAANAFHCANEYVAPWDYQSALYSDIDKLNTERYLEISKQLGIDPVTFKRCLIEKRYEKTVESDVQLAGKLGLETVPVVLVNGLYTKGPQTVERYQYYIQQELSRLDGAIPVQSTLPVNLLSTSVSSETKASTAIVQFTESTQIQTYHIGDRLMEGVFLIAVEKQRILIDHQARVEYIPLRSQSVDLPDAAVTDDEADLTISSLTRERPDEEEMSARLEQRLPMKGQMRLSKEWLNEQLPSQKDLQDHFQLAAHEVEGVHLLKLDNVEKVEFYQTLGFKNGDVLMRVNDQWVHEGHNPLWEALKEREEVTLYIMRKGFPVRYDFKVR